MDINKMRRFADVDKNVWDAIVFNPLISTGLLLFSEKSV